MKKALDAMKTRADAELAERRRLAAAERQRFVNGLEVQKAAAMTVHAWKTLHTPELRALRTMNNRPGETLALKGKGIKKKSKGIGGPSV